MIKLLLILETVWSTISDRIVALNAMSTQAAIVVLFFAVFANRTIDRDVALGRAVQLPGRHPPGPATWNGNCFHRGFHSHRLAADRWAFHRPAWWHLRMPDVYTRIQLQQDDHDGTPWR